MIRLKIIKESRNKAMVQRLCEKQRVL